eukprot:Rmarinus@m.9771
MRALLQDTSRPRTFKENFQAAKLLVEACRAGLQATPTITGRVLVDLLKAHGVAWNWARVVNVMSQVLDAAGKMEAFPATEDFSNIIALVLRMAAMEQKIASASARASRQSHLPPAFPPGLHPADVAYDIVKKARALGILVPSDRLVEIHKEASNAGLVSVAAHVRSVLSVADPAAGASTLDNEIVALAKSIGSRGGQMGIRKQNSDTLVQSLLSLYHERLRFSTPPPENVVTSVLNAASLNGGVRVSTAALMGYQTYLHGLRKRQGAMSLPDERHVSRQSPNAPGHPENTGEVDVAQGSAEGVFVQDGDVVDEGISVATAGGVSSALRGAAVRAMFTAGKLTDALKEIETLRSESKDPSLIPAAVLDPLLRASQTHPSLRETALEAMRHARKETHGNFLLQSRISDSGRNVRLLAIVLRLLSMASPDRRSAIDEIGLELYERFPPLDADSKAQWLEELYKAGAFNAILQIQDTAATAYASRGRGTDISDLFVSLALRRLGREEEALEKFHRMSSSAAVGDNLVLTCAVQELAESEDAEECRQGLRLLDTAIAEGASVMPRQPRFLSSIPPDPVAHAQQLYSILESADLAHLRKDLMIIKCLNRITSDSGDSPEELVSPNEVAVETLRVWMRHGDLSGIKLKTPQRSLTLDMHWMSRPVAIAALHATFKEIVVPSKGALHLRVVTGHGLGRNKSIVGKLLSATMGFFRKGVTPALQGWSVSDVNLGCVEVSQSALQEWYRNWDMRWNRDQRR